MTLILSSRDFLEEKPKKVILDHLPKPIEKCRVLFIPNENATPENLKMDKYFRRMRQKGFAQQNIFIFDHTRAEDYRDVPTDLIFVSGGNTFLTLKKLRDTGFDEEIARRVRAGTIYIGGSAGAHIVSKSITHIVKYDALPEGFDDFSGIGLFDGILICHFDESRRAHYEELRAAGEKVYALTNDESLVITDEEITRF